MALIPALNVDADLQALGETLIQPLTGEQPGERMSSADLGFEPGLKVASVPSQKPKNVNSGCG
ncbi:MAG: hypothetical protein KatS3mg113_0184 [Planctomycetaceae bacterium]|nr:MAG: hypothetical protein KatS3mg113_0184 [Planctomycetaceae bacterium]